MLRILLKTFAFGIVFGLGMSLAGGISFYAYKSGVLDRIIARVKPTGDSPQALDVVPFDDKDIPSNPYLDLKHYQQTPIPDDYSVYYVNDSLELQAALNSIKAHSGNGAIVLSDGNYHLNKTLYITVPNVMLLSKSANPKTVILTGGGMQKTTRVGNLIRVSASGFVIDGITLREANNHLIQIAAEQNADIPVIRNCILQDGYQQLLKVSYNHETPKMFSDSGLVENCLFEYTKGIGPNFYIGGIDAHGIRNWVIRNNVFKDIASPGKRIAEHAIHIWDNTSKNLIEGNVIIDSDRGIGLGMRQTKRHPNIRYSNLGDVIKNNMIYHSDNGDKFGDTGIILEDSPRTVIEGNYIFLEHNYPNAIEYRFPTTNHVIIKNNETNKAITSRNGGEAKLIGNSEDMNKLDFLAKLNIRLGELNLNN